MIKVETDLSAKLLEDITRLNTNIKDLEDELASRPEIRETLSSSTSSSSEKEDHSAELAEWKGKYEELFVRFEKMNSDYEDL